MTKVKGIASFIFLIFAIQSCKQKHDILFDNYRKIFKDSISKNDAVKIDYEFDNLLPQKSYFVNCRLKYLSIKSSGEFIDTESLYFFENDSITKVFKQYVVYEALENKAGRNWNRVKSDTIYIMNLKKKKEQVFSNNKLIRSVKIKDIDLEYIYETKIGTEKNYDCDK